MEVACGEYGDVVPQLVVAVKNSKCQHFQGVSETKVINPEKAVRDRNGIDANYLKEDGFLIDCKTGGFDPNLESYHAMRDKKLLEGCIDSDDFNDDGSLKNEKFPNEYDTCLKQVTAL